MKIRTIVMAGAMVAGFVLPAAAQGYWVVENSQTKTCTITTTRPTTTTETVVGPGGVAYTTRTEAMNAMKTIKVCHSGD